MRPGLDLDLRRDPIFDDARDDAGESIAGGLLGRLIAPGLALWLGDSGERFPVDEALPACCAYGDEPAIVDHAPHGVDADPEHLRRLPKPITRHCPENPSSRQRTAAFASK